MNSEDFLKKLGLPEEFIKGIKDAIEGDGGINFIIGDGMPKLVKSSCSHDNDEHHKVAVRKLTDKELKEFKDNWEKMKEAITNYKIAKAEMEVCEKHRDLWWKKVSATIDDDKEGCLSIDEETGYLYRREKKPETKIE